MADYGAPIPPLEPRPGVPPPASLEEVRDLLQAQRGEIDKLRSRSRVILGVAILAMFGACGSGSGNSSDSGDSQMRSDVTQTKQVVEDLRRQNAQLSEQVTDLRKQLPAPKATG